MMVQAFLLQSTPLKNARTFKLIVGVLTTKLNWTQLVCRIFDPSVCGADFGMD